MPITLTKDIRALRGGSQPRLMEADDGNLYVVKFKDNPQGTRVLVNELLAATLAERLGLPVPTTVVVELPPELSEGLFFQTPHGRQPIRPGRHLGSRLVVSGLEGRRYDYLPQNFRHLIRNPKDIVGIQVFDLWTCNRDEREYVVWRYSRQRRYTVSFIDNGHCFGGPEWKFIPMNLQKSTLIETSAIEEWRHWADRIGNFPIRPEGMVTDLIPPEWCDGKRKFSVIFEELRIRQEIIAREYAQRE